MIGAWLFGLRVAGRRLGVVTWIYVVSVFAALPFGLAFGFLADRSFSASAVGAALLTEAPMDLLLEWLRAERSAFSLFVPFGVGVLLSMLGWSAFFDGAVVAAVANEGPVRTGDFYSGGGRVFGRMLRLLVFGLPFTCAITGGAGALLYFGERRLTEGWVDERAVFGVQVAALVLLLIVLSWCKGAHDLMKVEAVAKGEHRARWAFVRGAARALVAPHRVLLANLPFLLAGTFLSGLAFTVDPLIPRLEPQGIAAGFALGQGVAFSRAYLEVAMTAVMVRLVRGRNG